MSEESRDVVILGAGLAGLTAAWQLRDLDCVVVERENRVGGRTYSGEWHDAWYNAGAQFVWDHRTLDLCRELGVPWSDARGAYSAIYIRDRLVKARHPYLLFLKMPLSIRERIDFASTILRLRRIASRYPNVDRMELDSKSLGQIMGKVTPITRTILDRVVESGMALSTDEVSGYIGLSYAIHLFGGDVNDVLKGVTGGTQRISLAIARELGDRVQLRCDAARATVDGDTVKVTYDHEGRENVIRAKACIVALPAGEVLESIDALSAEKREALKRMSPYGRAVSVACLTTEDGRPKPWHNFVVAPVVDRSFEILSHNSYFARQSGGAQSSGALVTIATMDRAEALWDLPDEEVSRRVVSDLREMFPSASESFARTEVNRWYAFPPFRPGSLRDQEVLRRRLGPFFFCGDYTAQPGTPGAVGSGFHTARVVRDHLQSPPTR